MLKKVLLYTMSAAIAAAALLPRPAPDQLIPAISGPKINLHMYKGKVIALAIVSTSCAECLETAQLLERLQTEMGPRGLQSVVLVGDDNAKFVATPFMQRYHLTMPVGYVTKDEIIKIANITNERPVAPILLFIDKQGTVRSQYFGDSEFFKNTETKMRAAINDLLKLK